MKPAHLVLADGKAFPGTLFGAERSATGEHGAAIGEAVFTTGMTGYEEVLTDPSYCGQLVTMTAPHIGNTGINIEDSEAKAPAVGGFIVHELSPITSNWRATESLDAYLKRHGIMGIAGIDTRVLTRHLRDHGSQMAAIGSEDVDTLADRARAADPMTGRDLTGQVSTSEVYTWSQGSAEWLDLERTKHSLANASASADRPHVVTVDFGCKLNILRSLVDAGCDVTVVPSTSSKADIANLNPDGVFLSNGPGDPEAVTHGIQLVRDLVGYKPLFGICLGHQLLSLALGGSTYKLKFGHRGLNQPVKDLSTGRIEVTTQNHGFCVDLDSLKGKCDITHVHLNDGTCEGMQHNETGAFSVQYHPESAAGPHDSRYLFDRFVQRIRGTN